MPSGRSPGGAPENRSPESRSALKCPRASKVLTVIRTMDAIERASRWKPPSVLFDELQNIVENLQDIVENSEDSITVPDSGSLMYARSWKSQVDRRESATLSIP
jgi:hypothetical protein